MGNGSARLPLYDFGTIWVEDCVAEMAYGRNKYTQLSYLGECDLYGHRKPSPSDILAKSYRMEITWTDQCVMTPPKQSFAAEGGSLLIYSNADRSMAH